LQFEGGRLVPVLATAETPGDRPNPALQAAVDFLERELQDGPKVGDILIRDAHDLENIKRPVLFKAAKQLKINMRDRIAGKAVWSIPEMHEMAGATNENVEYQESSAEFKYE
jgi:hypothetical protein